VNKLEAISDFLTNNVIKGKTHIIAVFLQYFSPNAGSLRLQKVSPTARAKK
jgi:hypothetical protein